MTTRPRQISEGGIPLTARDDADQPLGALRVGSRPYPYLVIRWMAAVYGTVEIRIVASENEISEGRHLTIVQPDHPESYAITTALRRKIIDAALQKCVQQRLPMCVVFAEDESVYVEPDGRTSCSSDPPRGGLRLDPARRT